MSVFGYTSASSGGDNGNQYMFPFDKTGLNFDSNGLSGSNATSINSPFAYNGATISNGWSHQKRLSGHLNGSVLTETEFDMKTSLVQQQYGSSSNSQQQSLQHSLNHVVLLQQQQHHLESQQQQASLQHLQAQANPYVPVGVNGAYNSTSQPQAAGTQYNPKIFVGGLSWSSNETSLQHYFSQFGAVDSVEIMRDRLTGNPRGFAFVIFAQDIAVDRVLAHPKHIIDCKLVDVKRAHARSNFGDLQASSAPPSKSSSPVTTSASPTNTSPHLIGNLVLGYNHQVRSSASSPVNSENTNESENLEGVPKSHLPEVQQNKIFIGGLHHAVDREELKSYFSKYGKVCDACVMFDPVTRRSRGFGFITYEANESAQRAISDQVHAFRDKTVELKLAQPKAQPGLPMPPNQTSSGVTPSKINGHHARAMSNVDFRQTPMADRAAPQSRGRHIRSSSAGADLIFTNSGAVPVHQNPQQGLRNPVVDRLSLETVNINSGTPARHATAHASSYQPQNAAHSASFVTLSHVHSNAPQEFVTNHTSSHNRASVPSLVNIPSTGTRNTSPAEPQGLTELETALYRRVSQLEGQLASAQADIFMGQQANSHLQEQVQELEKQVTQTRRSERALISMLNDKGKDNGPFGKSVESWGDSRWGAPVSSGSGDASEADIEKLKSVVTGLNGRLGNHDADVSERLLVSALLAEGQTDRALVDIIVELDDRLAIIEDKNLTR